MDSSRRWVLRSAVGAGGLAAAATIASAPAASATTSTGLDWLNVMDYGATGNGTTDDTSAINSALTAAAKAGGVVYFPAGTYLISSALVGASGVRLTGDHRSVSQIVSTSSSVLTLDGSLISGMEIDHLTLQATGADLITGADLKALHLYDCQLIQNSADYAIWNAPAAALMIECVFERNLESVAGSARTVAAWLLKGGGINANIWRDNVCSNLGGDDTQYWYQVIASASGGTNEVNTWDNIVFENPLGGMINLQSATRSRIQMCTAWDTTGTIANTLIAIGTYPGAGTSARAPTVIAGPDNRSGQVTFGSGSSPSTGTQVEVTFGTPFAVTPTVMLTPANGPTAGLLCAVESVSETGFNLVTGNAPAAGTANTKYGFYWQATD